MFAEQAKVTLDMQESATAACVELLQAYGVSTTPAPDGWVHNDELLLSGVMGFVGRDVRGSCLIAAPVATIQATAPADARARDWVGELANQLVGRFKSKLMTRGVTIALTTPIVLSGMRLSPLPRGDAEPGVLETETGRVLVWLEVEVDAAFQFGSERPLCAAEGDLLIF